MPLPGTLTPEQWAERNAKNAANIAAKKEAKAKNAADVKALIEKQGGEEAMEEFKRKTDEAVRRMGEDRRNRAYDHTHDDEATGIGKVRGTKPADFKSGDEPGGA